MMHKLLLLLLLFAHAQAVFAADAPQVHVILDREEFLERADDFVFDSFDDMAPGSYANGTQRNIDGYVYSLAVGPWYNSFTVVHGAEGAYLGTPYPKDYLRISPAVPGMNAFGIVIPKNSAWCWYCSAIQVLDAKGRYNSYYLQPGQNASFFGIVSAEPITSISVSNLVVRDLYFASVTVVPEPAQALLLLAGLPILIRRGRLRLARRGSGASGW